MLLSVCAQRLCAAALQFITVIPGIITHRAPDYNINLAKTVIKQTDAAYPDCRKLDIFPGMISFTGVRTAFTFFPIP